LHDPKRDLGGEAFASARPTPLQDRPPRPGRHPGPKAVPALPPANVGLIGPFHEKVRVEGPSARDAGPV
jgi:hypothetical protein